MKKFLVAIVATASVALHAPAAQARSAAPDLAELQAAQRQMQAQIQALTARLDGLEAANTALRGENAGLRRELAATVGQRDADVARPATPAGEPGGPGAPASADLDRLKGAEWASRLSFRGDLRVRQESIQSQRVVGSGATADVEDAANRDRVRFRARLAAEARVTDGTRVVLGLASGDGDPRSTNQTMTNVASGKQVNIDLAYADWGFAPGAHAVLGKQKLPLWRPAYSLFWDADFNPEGGAVTFERGRFFGSAYAWWLQENYNADPAGNNEDANILGAQAGVTLPAPGGELKLAAIYYDCGACRHNNPFWSGGSAYGNTTITQGSGSSAVQVLAYDYNVAQLQAQYTLGVGGRPLQLWADYAKNTAAGVEHDQAYNFGAWYGKAADPGTWELALAYQFIGKDALFAQLIDSDFAAGNTDGGGWGLRGGYAPARNVVLNLTYFINELNQDVAPVAGPGYAIGRDLAYDRLMLDVLYRF